MLRLHGALSGEGVGLVVVAPPGTNAARLLGLVALSAIGEIRPTLAEALACCGASGPR